MAYGRVSPDAAATAPVDRVDREPAGQQRADHPEGRVVGRGAVDQDQRRPDAAAEDGDRRAVGRGDPLRGIGRGGQRGRLAAAAASRIQVAPARRASWAGQRPGSCVAPKTSARTAALPAPVATTRTRRAARDDRRVEGDPLDPRLDVGWCRDRQGELVGAEGRGAREDRQQMTVGCRHRAGAGRRRANRRRRPVPPSAARRRGLRHTRPRRASRRSPRPSGMGGGSRWATARPAPSRRPRPPRSGRSPAGCRRAA